MQQVLGYGLSFYTYRLVTLPEIYILLNIISQTVMVTLSALLLQVITTLFYLTRPVVVMYYIMLVT